MGLAIIVAEKDVDKSIRILKNNSSVKVKVVGRIEKGSGVEVPDLGLEF